jgi:hypothetical protein
MLVGLCIVEVAEVMDKAVTGTELEEEQVQ